MKNKNVLHLVEYLYLGGIERVLEQMTTKIGPETKLHFFTYETEELKGIGKSISERGFPVFTYKKKAGRDWQLVKKLARICREHKIDVVHTHDFGPVEYAFLLKFFCPWIKLIHTQHTMHHFIIHRRYRYFFQVASYFYSSIIGVSSFVKESIRKHCPFTNPLALKVIFNGVDVDLFHALEHSSCNEKLRLVSIARMSYEKNLEYIFNTCRLLKDAGVPFELHHAGTAKKPEIIDNHQKYIREHQLDEFVKLHGYVDDAHSILKKGDIFVSASKVEGHPVSVLEAMAAERLCLCSNIAPHREISDQEIILYNHDDEQALFHKLKTIYESRIDYSEKRKKSRELIQRKFSLQTMVNQYVHEYFS